MVCDFPSTQHLTTFTYVSVFYKQHRLLWNSLTQLYSALSISRVIYGDFNVFLGSREKIGLSHSQVSCEDFANVVSSLSIHSIETQGSFYTWSQKGARSYVECKLDRSFYSASCLDFWDVVSCSTLPRHQFDHNPLVVLSNRGSVPFRF